MDIIEWNEKFSVGNYNIDEQHKELIKIINEVTTVIREKQYTFSNLLSIVCKLDDYVIQHFQYEEKFMEANHIEGKEKHIKEHDFARQKMDSLNVLEQENFEEKFFFDTLGWLCNWLVNHIMNTDKMLNIYNNSTDNTVNMKI